MADRSLTYFLFFICLWLVYALYLQEVENERLFNIATKQKERLDLQVDLINAQTLYLELLSPDLIEEWAPPAQSPIYSAPL